MTFTPREHAHTMYGVALDAPRSVFGLPKSEVTASRAALLQDALQVVTAALSGPARRWLAEPDDEQLHLMAERLRSEIDACPVNVPAPSAPAPPGTRLIGARSWSMPVTGTDDDPGADAA